jgi:hypothetical protein
MMAKPETGQAVLAVFSARSDYSQHVVGDARSQEEEFMQEGKRS